MAKISDLVFRYLHRDLTSSKTTPTQFIVTHGTLRSATANGLGAIEDYWRGAVVRWDEGANHGLYSAIRSYDPLTGSIGLETDLPYTVEAGDRFTLFLGGKYASSERIPALAATVPVNIKGFAILEAAMLNGVGTGELKFWCNAGGGPALAWKAPGADEWGAEIPVGDLTEGDSVVLSGGGVTEAERSKFIIVKRTAEALSETSETDAVELELRRGSFLPIFPAALSSAGATVYRPLALENTAESSLYALKVYCSPPWQDALGTTLLSPLGVHGDLLQAVNLDSWGSHGFVFNSTRNDLRYFYHRSHASARIMSPQGGIRGFEAVPWEVGDRVEAYPWFDIAVEFPGENGLFENPDSGEPPAGVTFSAPRSLGEALNIGDLSGGAIFAIWERFYIPAGFMPLESGRADLHLVAETMA